MKIDTLIYSHERFTIPRTPGWKERRSAVQLQLTPF